MSESRIETLRGRGIDRTAYEELEFQALSKGIASVYPHHVAAEAARAVNEARANQGRDHIRGNVTLPDHTLGGVNQPGPTPGDDPRLEAHRNQDGRTTLGGHTHGEALSSSDGRARNADGTLVDPRP